MERDVPLHDVEEPADARAVAIVPREAGRELADEGARAGLAVLPGLRVEVFPEFSADLVTVNVAYPGAAPEETEEAICMRLEEELQGITGIDRITSDPAIELSPIRSPDGARVAFWSGRPDNFLLEH